MNPTVLNTRSTLREMSLEMIRDVLSFAEKPDEAIPKVIDELRELTGSRFVVLYRCSDLDYSGQSGRIIAVNPQRKIDLLNKELIESLINVLNKEKTIVVVSSEEQFSTFPFLSEIGSPVTVLMPLLIGDFLFGGILLIGLPTTYNLELIIDGLESLSSLLALVIRYSQLYSDIEQEVRERTRDLAASEQQLRAANQQLRANEQQLRSANQQLEANEQQLMAANQHLEANDQQLRAANKQLEEKNRQLTLKQEELKKALEKAEESEKLKSAFLANMSHEIRTPMNGILGFIELINEPDIDNPDRLRYVDIVRKSSQRLLNTINDIMDISKIEAGEVQLNSTPVHVNKIMEELTLFFTPEAKSRNLDLVSVPGLPDGNAVIFSDEKKIYGILTNLIKNALKFTDHGNVTFGYMRKGKFLEFYVKDTGIGIPGKRKDAIFNRFVQSDFEDKRARQGSGLGLSISKAYVELMGGKIWVKSEEDVGSEFIFTVPYSLASDDCQDDIVSVPEEDHGSMAKLKIVVAEDDETSSFYLKTVLKDLCSELFLAGTGTEAVRICRDVPDVDVVLMDLKMPDMDGFEATREIRRFNKDVAIIAQTAYALEGDREKVFNAGCNDYITKPINQAELIGKLSRIKPVSSGNR